MKSTLVFFVTSLLLLYSARQVDGGCQLDFNKMKHRRLEAIRGQILSKLGFQELPRNQEDIREPTEDELRLYNVTKEFAAEEAKRKKRECGVGGDDKYYAQDLHTVYEKDNAIIGCLYFLSYLVFKIKIFATITNCVTLRITLLKRCIYHFKKLSFEVKL